MRQLTIDKYNKDINFHEVFSKILSEKLISSLVNKPLNNETCLQFYCEIFDGLTEILTKTNIKLNNEAANYISQQYYFSIVINGSEILQENIFNKLALLENIPTQELILIAMLFRGTDFLIPVISEIKKRR